MPLMLATSNHSKARGDLGISYDQEVLRLIDKFNELEFLLAPLSSHSTLVNQLQMPSETSLRKTELILIFIIQSKDIRQIWITSFLQKEWEKMTTSKLVAT